MQTAAMQMVDSTLDVTVRDLLTPMAVVTVILIAITLIQRILSRTSISTPSKDTTAVVKKTEEEEGWWVSPLASAAEQTIIDDALGLVRADGLEPLPPHVDLELLRQLRALGKNCKPRTLASQYGKHLKWRREHVVWPAAVVSRGG